MNKSAILFFVVLSLGLMYTSLHAGLQGYHTLCTAGLLGTAAVVWSFAKVDNYWRRKYHVSRRRY